jgi:hypothetical protein
VRYVPAAPRPSPQGEQVSGARCDCARDHAACSCGYAREECECGTLGACILTWDRAKARGDLDGARHKPKRLGGCKP